MQSQASPHSVDRRPSRKKPRLPARRGMTFSAKLVIGLFFLFVVVYMARGVHEFFRQPVDIMTLRLGNVEREDSVQGMIIRYEDVFFADRDGRVAFEVLDFDRVRRGDLVASVQDIEEVIRIERDLVQIRRETISVHEMRHATTTDPHVGRVNASLQNRMNRHAPNNMERNMSEMYALLATLTQITENRNNMITTESMHARGDLTRRYGILNDQFQMNSNDIYATRTGIMSPLIDGFENREGFTPDTMTGLDREQVRMSADLDTIIPGREVYRGDGIFKIVGNTWYIASWVPHEMVHGFVYGDHRIIYLESDTTGRFERVPVRVHHINPTHRDTFIIFRTNHNVVEFLSQRNVNIRMAGSVQRGFTVPSSAIVTRRFYQIPLTHIHERDEFYYVLHRGETTVVYVPIEVARRSDTHVYVLEDIFPLRMGDTLAAVPHDPPYPPHMLSENNIDIVQGIYRAQLNVTRFAEVDIDHEAFEAGAGVLIDPVRNPHISQFDTIITDASMVRENQVVR